MSEKLILDRLWVWEVTNADWRVQTVGFPLLTCVRGVGIFGPACWGWGCTPTPFHSTCPIKSVTSPPPPSPQPRPARNTVAISAQTHIDSLPFSLVTKSSASTNPCRLAVCRSQPWAMQSMLLTSIHKCEYRTILYSLAKTAGCTRRYGRVLQKQGLETVISSC